jgi:hypothetical protein
MKNVYRLPLVLIFVACTCWVYGQNVGIGTLTPAYKLDILGRARIQAGTVNNVSTSAGFWHTDYRTNTDLVFVGMADSVNYGFYGSRPGVGWQFFFDARFGNIGIGRKPPSGNTRLALDHPDGAEMLFYSNGSFRGGMSATDSTLQIFSARSLDLFTPGKDLIIWPPPPPCTGQICPIAGASGRTGFYTNNPASKVHFVASTGTSGVLIGSTNAIPATGYMLSVDGKIICEELKVQLNSAWPDYVFEKNYNLLSLDALEQKVMTEKHLPGIPAASEVEGNKGVEVGAVQQKLLEKVEELYRYVFEINKENKQLRQELELLKKEKH